MHYNKPFDHIVTNEVIIAVIKATIIGQIKDFIKSSIDKEVSAEK